MGPVQKLISIVHWKGSEVLAFCGTLESVSNSRDLPFAEHSKGWMAKTFLNFNGNTCHCQANQYLWSQLKVAVASSLNLCCVQQFMLVWRVIKGWPTWSDGIYMRACAIKLNDGTQTHYLIKWVENFTVKSNFNTSNASSNSANYQIMPNFVSNNIPHTIIASTVN